MFACVVRGRNSCRSKPVINGNHKETVRNPKSSILIKMDLCKSGIRKDAEKYIWSLVAAINSTECPEEGVCPLLGPARSRFVETFAKPFPRTVTVVGGTAGEFGNKIQQLNGHYAMWGCSALLLNSLLKPFLACFLLLSDCSLYTL